MKVSDIDKIMAYLVKEGFILSAIANNEWTYNKDNARVTIEKI